MKSCNKKELEFSVFIINKLAERTGNNVDEIYKTLTDNELEFLKMIVPGYC